MLMANLTLLQLIRFQQKNAILNHKPFTLAKLNYIFYKNQNYVENKQYKHTNR